MAVPRSLQLPGPEYSEEEERQFRRELEDYLLSISSDLAGAQTRLGTVSSQATKRSLLSMIPVGQVEVPTGEGSHLSANISIESGTSSLTSGEANFAYEAVPTGWTANVASDWAEGTGPADGKFKYTGAEARNFLILWNLNLGWRTSGTYAQRTAIAGKVEKDDGGGFSIVPGSFQISASRMQYLTYLGSYFFQGGVSGGAISSVEPDDLISFRWGYHNKNTAGGSYTAVLQSTTPDSGATINIVPVGE